LHNAGALQAAFNALGANPQLTVDHSYGRETRRAVEAFQQAVGLIIDGLAGPATWAAINANLKQS
jgi:peptidoglycan hydrolase-like protein with peptidoglycan-binding domain